jgi:hypothetical protein
VRRLRGRRADRNEGGEVERDGREQPGKGEAQTERAALARLGAERLEAAVNWV